MKIEISETELDCIFDLIQDGRNKYENKLWNLTFEDMMDNYRQELFQWVFLTALKEKLEALEESK